MKALPLLARHCGRRPLAAVTLIEILIVVLVLAVAAVIVIPKIGSAADSQVASAAQVLQSDLEIARSLALTTQQTHSLVFSADRRSFKVVANYTGGAYDAVMAVNDPVKAGKKLEVTLAALNGMNAVTVTNVNFGGQTYVTFQSSGDPVTPGSVTLQSGRGQMVVSVEGLTGIVTVQRTAG